MATCASPSSHIPMDDDDSSALSTPHSQFHRRHGSNVSSESSSPMLLARHFHGKWMESPSSKTRHEKMDKTVPSSSSSSSSPSLPASEHPDWLGSFQFGDIITTGSTGSIRTGTHSETHAITTIVMVDKKGQLRGGRHMKKELMEMKNDEHPHILKLYDVLETWNRFYLILEHATGGNLFHHLLHHGALSCDESLRLTAQLIDATMYQQQHTSRMMDIEDVMLDHEMDIKLCDTRIRHMIWADQEGGPKLSHPYCSPPELLDLNNISNIDTTKCDVWTIGCLFYLMLTGEMPFGEDSSTNKRIISGSWIPHPAINTECTLLLQLMLAEIPTSRSTLLSLSTNSAFRDHTFLSSMPSSATTSSRSLTSTPLTDMMMADVEEEDRIQPLHEKKQLHTPKPSQHNNNNTGIAALQSRLDHLHELALMSPNTHKRRISGQSVLPSSIYVPQSDPPTPSRSNSKAPSQSPSVAASPSTPFRSLSATASPSNFRRTLPHLTLTGSPREANRRLSSNASSSRARVVLVNENINGDEAIWRPTVVPSPARSSTTTIPPIRIPSPQPQPQMPLFPPLSLMTSKSNGATCTSTSPSIPTSPDLAARAITIDPSPRKLPIDPMYASPRVQGRPLKGFMPSFHIDTTTTSQPESPVNSRPRTPHPAIAVDDINATTIEAPIPIAATQPIDLVRPSPHRREMSHELAHLSIDAQTTPHSTSRPLIPDRSHTGSITLSVSTPITTVTTPRVQPPPAKSSFPSSSPIAATCPMPTRRLSLPSPSSHDDHHTLIKNPIKAHHQHGYLTTSIYQMEIDGNINDVTKKLIHVMKEMGITYKQQKNEMECEYIPSSTNDHIKSPHNLVSEKDDTIPTSTHDHVKFHIELKSEHNHTCIRLDHVFGSFDIYRTAFMKLRHALQQHE